MLDAAPRVAILIALFVVSAWATRRSKPAESSGAFRRRTSFVSERILSALVIDTSKRSAAIGLIRKSVAPACIAETAFETDPFDVSTRTGRSGRCGRRARRTSIPVISGIARSRRTKETPPPSSLFKRPSASGPDATSRQARRAAVRSAPVMWRCEASSSTIRIMLGLQMVVRNWPVSRKAP